VIRTVHQPQHLPRIRGAIIKDCGVDLAELRDAIETLSHRHYGYRRIGAAPRHARTVSRWSIERRPVPFFGPAMPFVGDGHATCRDFGYACFGLVSGKNQ